MALALLCLLSASALGLGVWQNSARRAGRQMWLEEVICGAAAPAQSALLLAAQRAEGAWASLVKSRRLAEENARLSARVAYLQSKLDDLTERYAGAARERALRHAYPRSGHGGRPPQLARVIAVGLGGWLSYLVIDAGSQEGVRLRDVAVTREGVVGQVYAVAGHSARVLPVTDPASGVAVRLQRSREVGLLKGTGDWRCELRHLGPQAQVRVGDELLTAGIGGVFPKGLRAGRVISVAADRNTTGKVAVVEPAAGRLQNVEEVLLLRAAAEQ
jgi:rod shape-determining protein MreC